MMLHSDYPDLLSRNP